MPILKGALVEYATDFMGPLPNVVVFHNSYTKLHKAMGVVVAGAVTLKATTIAVTWLDDLRQAESSLLPWLFRAELGPPMADTSVVITHYASQRFKSLQSRH